MTTVVSPPAPAPAAAPPLPPRRRPRWIVAGAVAVLVPAIVLRFVVRSELWLDEALSVQIARLPVSQIPGALRHDGAPPLYYLFLHFWMELFGTGNVAVRGLSGVFSVAMLPVMYLAGRRIASKRVGV